MPPLGVWCVCCRPSSRFMQTHIHTPSHPHFRRLRSNILRDGNPTTFPHPLPQPVNVNSSSVLILKSGFIRGQGPRAPPTILKGQLWPRRSTHAGHVQPARLSSAPALCFFRSALMLRLTPLCLTSLRLTPHHHSICKNKLIKAKSSGQRVSTWGTDCV